jgi:hypothetical protein
VKHGKAINNRIVNVYGDGFEIWRWLPGERWRPDWQPLGGLNTPSYDIRIIGNRVSGVGRHALGLIDGRYIHFEKNTIRRTGYWVVDMEPDSPREVLEHIWVAHNDFGDYRIGAIAASGPTPASYIEILYNRASPSGTMGFNFNITSTDIKDGRRSHDWVIYGNSSSADFGWSPRLIWIRSIDKVKVQANDFPCLVGRLGQRFNATQTKDTNAVWITDNSFKSCGTVNVDKGSWNLRISRNET